MKRKLTFAFIIGAAILLVLSGMRQIRRLQAEPPKSIGQLQDEKGVPVEVARVERGIFSLSRSYLGTVEGALQGDAIAMLMDKIVEIPVKVGDRVKKGEVVCRFDTESRMASYHQLKLAYEDAQRDYRRMENLFSAGAISEQALEKARLARDVAERNFRSAADLVELTAPLDGVVTDVFLRVGETPMQGEPVVRVADLSQVKIRFSVNYDDWRRLTEDNPVYVRLNGSGEEEIPAKITTISLSADPKTRLFRVWVQAENRDGKLQPGLMVDVRVVVVRKPDAVLLPRDAKVTRNEVSGAFVVNDDKRAVFTPFKAGDANATMIEVTDGLEPGQMVVVYGQNNLNDGQLVNIVHD